MDAKKLVKMANEIAAFFEADADVVARQDGIAGHIKRFWDPRMRRALLEHLDREGGEGLKESVRAALRAHRVTLTPAPQR